MVPKMEAFEAILNVEIQSTAVMLSPKDCVQKWPEQSSDIHFTTCRLIFLINSEIQECNS